MTKMLAFLLLTSAVLAAPRSQAAPPARVEQVMSRPLADLAGKEGLVLTVTYPPGGADAIHRHKAHAFVYVLEGAIVMQVKGGPAVTLEPGQGFYEAPDDIHLVGRNASQTERAKFVVFLLKDQGVPAVMPVR
ncbi:cupin [Methylibium sp. Pch-M]|uniref:cupin domain-containing protein n=1 Tax=Methylibium sp. Pch-M TaxID=2082386 RepID=UPI0010136BE6|nr:cupin domain-containing protein [Methylibium sp. Pch-M]QAZ40424.1 cupin [Methylibium sp. Pch-M]